MEKARDPDRVFPSELGGDRVELCALVVFEVLECVDDVEAGDPEQDHDRDGVDLGCVLDERWVDRDCCGDGGCGECAAEEDMAEEGEAFGEGVEPDPDKDGDGEESGEPVVVEESEACCGKDESGGASEEEEVAVADGEFAACEGAALGSGVCGVELCVCDAVDEHGPCPCEDHGEDDEWEHAEEGGPVNAVFWRVCFVWSDEECAEDREGEGEDGVGELDVAEREREAMGEGELGWRSVDGGHWFFWFLSERVSSARAARVCWEVWCSIPSASIWAWCSSIPIAMRKARMIS